MPFLLCNAALRHNGWVQWYCMYCRNGGVKQAMSKLWGLEYYLNIFQSCVLLTDRGVLVGLIGLVAWWHALLLNLVCFSYILCYIEIRKSLKILHV